MERFAVKLLRPPGVLMEAPASVCISGDVAVGYSKLRDPSRVRGGEDGLMTEAWSRNNPSEGIY